MLTDTTITGLFANAPASVPLPTGERRTPTPPASQWHIDNPRYVPTGGNRRTPTPSRKPATVH